MLYDAVCHANLQSVIRYPYPIRIPGIVENDIRIRKNSRISANIYPRFHICAPLLTDFITLEVVKPKNRPAGARKNCPTYHCS